VVGTAFDFVQGPQLITQLERVVLPSTSAAWGMVSPAKNRSFTSPRDARNGT
jgi:hypothetical protein